MWTTPTGMDRAFSPNEHTERLFHLFFTACLKAAGQLETSRDAHVDLLPVTFQAELSELFGDSFSFDMPAEQLAAGLQNMAASYISGLGRCARINVIRNCAFRVALATLTPNILTTTADMECLARDYGILRDPMFAPIDWGLQQQQTALAASAVNTMSRLGDNVSTDRDGGAGIFRSLSCGPAQVQGLDVTPLEAHLDNASRDMQARCEATMGFQTMAQLGQAISDAVARELSCNPEVQQWANQYLQRKLVTAIATLRGAAASRDNSNGSRDNSNGSAGATQAAAAPAFAVATRVVFTDGCGLFPGVVTRQCSNGGCDVRLDNGFELPSIPLAELHVEEPERVGAATRAHMSAVVGQPVDRGDGRVPSGGAGDREDSSRNGQGKNPAGNSAGNWDATSSATILETPTLSTQLMPEHIPPHTPLAYYLSFNNKKFWFDQRDIGVCFRELLSLCGVAEAVLDAGAHAAAVNEPNRCFFLHLGLAAALNPYALQACYRREAHRLLSGLEHLPERRQADQASADTTAAYAAAALAAGGPHHDVLLREVRSPC